MNKFIKIFLVTAGALVIISAIITVLLGSNDPILLQTKPDLTEKIGIYTQFEFVFDQNLSESFIETCSLSSDPKLDFQLSTNKTSLFGQPTTRFEADSNYLLTLKCHDKSLFQKNIQTQSPDDFSLEDIIKLQGELDYETGQSIKNELEARPWRASLPLITPDYEVLYSQVENKYFVHLKLGPTEKPDLNKLSAEIKQKLQGIEAPDLELVWK